MTTSTRREPLTREEMMTRKAMTTERNEALAAGDIKRFQELTTAIANLPMPGVAPLTQKDIDRYARRGRS